MKYLVVGEELIASQVCLGTWPMAGITTLGAHRESSLATIRRAHSLGITLFDTAHSYGYSGECDRLLADVRQSLGIGTTECSNLRDICCESNDPKFLQKNTSQGNFFVASKVGQYWDKERKRIIDASPDLLIEHAEIEYKRLGHRCIDLLYLHSPDPKVPLAESAAAMREIQTRGYAKRIGVCNVDLEQTRIFVRECPIVAIQVPFNMFQQESLKELRTFASEQGIRLVGYWVLMKGLLAGGISRDHKFHSEDVRKTYPIFQGAQWDKAHNLLDLLRPLATSINLTVPQLVVAWSLAKNRLDIALIGAKNPQQIEESVLSRLQDEDAELERARCIERTIDKVDDILDSLAKC